jgi:hypothetical protein
MRKAKLITALSLTVVMLVAMTGLVVADGVPDNIRFFGDITDADGNPYPCTVEIKNSSDGSIGTHNTPANGHYTIPDPLVVSSGFTAVAEKNDTYRMYINGNLVDTKVIDGDDWSQTPGGGYWETTWYYEWSYQIPEFATIAIPVASILGLLFFFNHRKRKE